MPDPPDRAPLSPACTPGAVRAEGRGLQPKGLRVNEVADFKVYTKGGGSGDLKVTVKGPSECRGGPCNLGWGSLNLGKGPRVLGKGSQGFGEGSGGGV